MPHDKNYAAEFKGFDDYIEIVKVGDHVAMNGEKISFTTADLDAMASNTMANTAPIVVGHPKTDAPAYGWATEFKRDGDSLFAKFDQVNPTFAEWVKGGAYKKRSVRVAKGENGWRIKHIGWLGAAAPAIEGMADMQFAADDTAVEFEFGVQEFASEVGYMFNSVGNFLRSMRDKMIEGSSVEVADKYFPEWQLSSIQNASETLRARLADNSASADPSAINAAFAQVLTDTITAEITAQNQKSASEIQFAARESELLAKNAELQTKLNRQATDQQVKDWLQAGKLTPATASGVADFMAALPEVTFEFASGDDKAQASPSTFFAQFVAKLSPINFGQQQATGDLPETLNTADPAALEFAARAYQKEQSDKGITIDWTDACVHVSKQPPI
jgi:hypothetical protein